MALPNYHDRPTNITHCQKCGKELTKRQRSYRSFYCGFECGGTKRITNTYECKVCHKVFKPKARERKGLFCSRACSFKGKSMGLHKEREKQPKKDPMIGKSCNIYYDICTECFSPFVKMHKKGKQQCSEQCVESYRRKRNTERKRISEGYTLYIKECEICKKELKTWKKSQKVHVGLCQARWNRINHNIRAREYISKKNGVNDIRIVFADSVGKCQLCGRQLSLLTKHPHPRSCSMDHIIPISCGGADEYYNLQLACFICNSNKGNRSMPGGEQLKFPTLMAGA